MVYDIANGNEGAVSRICEERGSGIDKVVFEVELFQLPAPLFEKPDGFTRTVLFEAGTRIRSYLPFSAAPRPSPEEIA